jgi:hypothetical protein
MQKTVKVAQDTVDIVAMEKDLIIVEDIDSLFYKSAYKFPKNVFCIAFYRPLPFTTSIQNTQQKIAPSYKCIEKCILKERFAEFQFKLYLSILDMHL